MLLCIDVGNTNIKLGLFDGQELRHHWRIATERTRLADEYAMLLQSFLLSEGLSKEDVTGCAVSSVVPALTEAFGELARRHLRLEPLVVGPGVKTGMLIRAEHAAEVGADLVTSAVAAREMYGVPVIVVGFGTATTFTAVSDSGELEGVAIAPGVETSVEALVRSAAVLPRVLMARPPHAIGKNTIHSMQSGIVWGFAALVEGLVKRIRAELGGKAYVVATGGLARLIAPETDVIDVINPELTLIGLRLIYELNRS